MEDLIEQARAYERRAEQTWTYREVLLQLLPHLENVAKAGDSKREAGAIRSALEACFPLTRACSKRDPSMEGVATGVERLIRAINKTDNLRTEPVEEALETLILEINLCISREQ